MWRQLFVVSGSVVLENVIKRAAGIRTFQKKNTFNFFSSSIPNVFWYLYTYPVSYCKFAFKFLSKLPLEWISAIITPWREMSSLVNNRTSWRCLWPYEEKQNRVSPFVPGRKRRKRKIYRFSPTKSLAESDRVSYYQQDALMKRKRTMQRKWTEDPRSVFL